MAHEHNGLEHVYEEVRAFVEQRCGPGSLSRDTFNELCRLGAAGFRRIEAEGLQLRDPLLERLGELELRVERLEAEVEALRARVERLQKGE